MGTVATAGDVRAFTSEIKFVVDSATGERIREWARLRLDADPHGGGPFSDAYTVTSLYFDTEGRDVFFRRGSHGRSKYRIRRYHEEPTVFLERKLRVGGRLAKRRTSFPEAMLPLLTGASLNGDASAWFRRRIALRQLRPVCQVGYLRTARMSETPEGAARLTLDDQIAGFATETCWFESRPAVALNPGRVVLELKYRGRVPGVFRELVDAFALSPQRWSKYRAAAETLGLVRGAADVVPYESNA
jgi:hypothetical protein